MFQGRDLTSLVKELERQASVKRDFRAPTNLLEMSVTKPQSNVDVLEKQVPGDMHFRIMSSQKFEGFDGGVTELFHDQLAKHCGIPAAYYDRMRHGSQQDRAMAASNVNHWLRREKETRLVRTLDGNVRAFLSSRYRTIDNIDVAQAALPVLIQESKKLGSVKVMSSEVTDRRLYIKAVSDRLTFEVKKGDAVQAGISISNSEVGKGSVRVEPFLLRLICLNGAVIEDSAVRKFHIGRQSAELEAAEQVFSDATREQDDKAFMMKLQDVVRAAFDDEVFNKFKGLTIDASTRKIKAPVQEVVEEIANKYSLKETHKDSFLTNLIEGKDLSQWGVMNAITAIANTAEDYETATELEKIGGSILMMSKAEWSTLAEA